VFGVLQTATHRFTIAVPAAVIHEHLTKVDLIREWAWPQQYPTAVGRLTAGLEFTSYLGPVAIGHRVTVCEPGCLDMVLWGAVDGFSQWRWGDGWVAQTCAGVSVIPLEIGQYQLLHQLEQYLTTKVNPLLP
jgi:hypothetical protein